MPLDVLFSTTWTASEVLGSVLSPLRPYQRCAFNTTVAGVAIWTLLRMFHTSRQRLCTTQLRGPPSGGFLYGISKRICDAKDSGALYESWAKEYGPVYAIPSTLGSKRIVLCDPKAITHFYAKETRTYIQTPLESYTNLYRKGLLWADGENYKNIARQRKSLAPAFSIAAIGRLTWIFYDSAYKAKAAWDTLITSSTGDSVTIEVQNWMNHIALDTVGLACFSHGFGALDGKRSSVTEAFDTFSASRSTALSKYLLLLAQTFPCLIRVPTPHERLVQKLNIAMNMLLDRTQKELGVGVVGGKGDKTIIGVLIKGASGDPEFRLTKDDVISQMTSLLLAGYETTSIALTWALLELSRNPDVQTKLRNELLELVADPTYEQFTSNLPYLDAVVHETLRVHPPVLEVTRVAIEDDVIPLSEPVRTKSGKLVESLAIAKGTLVAVSIECMNRFAAIWGDDAKVFRPSRWLEDAHGQNGIPTKAKEIQGHRHLLTFGDGPRMCLGKNFAVTNLKVVLTVLVKNFVFELCGGGGGGGGGGGVDSNIEINGGVLPRPKLASEAGCKVPLGVRLYAA